MTKDLSMNFMDGRWAIAKNCQWFLPRNLIYFLFFRMIRDTKQILTGDQAGHNQFNSLTGVHLRPFNQQVSTFRRIGIQINTGGSYLK